MHESIGTSGSADTYDGRAIAELELGIAFLKAYVGEPPKGCRLEIVEHEHELGVYGTIGLCWDIGSLGEEEWEYYRRCEDGLTRLNDAVEWSALARVLYQGIDNDDDDDIDEAYSDENDSNDAR